MNDNLSQRYRRLSTPERIIALTVTIFALTQCYQLLRVLCCVTGYEWWLYLALPANIHDVLLKPWTLLTYMFVHTDLANNPFHLLLNMLVLYWFGKFYMRYHTGRQFLSLYLTGGLFAGIFFLLIYNIFPYFVYELNFTRLVGASGALFALMVAIALERPDEGVELRFLMWRRVIRMKWIVAAAVAWSMLSIAAGHTAGNICHLGGALWGLCYGVAARRGILLTATFDRCCDFVAQLFKPRRKMKVERGGARYWHGDVQKDMDYNRERRAREAQIDAILDKMRKSGYDGLTEEEKRTLFTAGKK